MKYFIFDLDDTLLNNNRKVSDYSLKGINILKENDFLIVINTARSFRATKEIYDIIKPDYCICNAGATIYDANNNLIFKRTISIEHTNEYLDIIKKSVNIENFSIQTINNLYTCDKEYAIKNPISTYNNFEEELIEESVKILIASYDYDKWVPLAKKYNYETERYFNGIWFRISPTNKYKGNIDLFQLLNDNNPIDYVFGDDLGDFEMINKAYCGVLMKNSKFVNDQFNVSQFTNDEDGAIKYMLIEALNIEI